VREHEGERASEIAGEFYPQNKRFDDESSGVTVEAEQRTRQSSTGCELARLLGDSKDRVAWLRRITGQDAKESSRPEGSIHS
jgi:hypothetical protein